MGWDCDCFEEMRQICGELNSSATQDLSVAAFDLYLDRQIDAIKRIALKTYSFLRPVNALHEVSGPPQLGEGPETGIDGPAQTGAGPADPQEFSLLQVARQMSILTLPLILFWRSK